MTRQNLDLAIAANGRRSTSSSSARGRRAQPSPRGLRSPRARPSVALIEAGPAKASLLSDVPLGIAALVPLRSRRNYAYETAPQPGFGGRRGYQPRGRGLGGSSLINAMIYMRGQPQDYDSWAALGCKGWAWSDVLPYFKRSEDNARGADALHGVGGPLHVSDLSYPNPAVEAFVEAAVASRICAERRLQRREPGRRRAVPGVPEERVAASTPRAPICKLRPRPISRSFPTVRRKRSCSTDKRAVGVAYRRGGKEERLYARREIVVCRGAFGSPQLLMVSGVGPADELRRFGIAVVHDAPEVGANLQDHCDYVANLRAKGPGLFGYTLPTLLRGVGWLAEFVRHGRGS